MWCAALLAVVLAAAPSQADDDPPFPDPASIPAVDAIVVVKDFGEFRIRFYRDEAPNHVAQFLSLVAEGYYDHLSFHRVLPDLLIQAGDPATRKGDREPDAEESPYRLPPEPTERPILRGTVAMAWNESTPGTAATQWFVSLGDFPEMQDGTVIGEVVEGMDVVDRVSQVSTFATRVPFKRVDIEEIRLARSLTTEEVPGDSARAESGADASPAD
jgi:cyclophilin family peptidyl-prolyl cis-trans isomerase